MRRRGTGLRYLPNLPIRSLAASVEGRAVSGDSAYGAEDRSGPTGHVDLADTAKAPEIRKDMASTDAQGALLGVDLVDE